MSEFRGFKCDVCGKVSDTGVRMAGDKGWKIVGGACRRGYRLDFCDECFRRMMEFSGNKAFEEEKGDGK